LTKIIRVDLSKDQVTVENSPPEFEMLSGRALISKILIDEVVPTCDPLGPGNKLIIAPGILGGTTVSCVNRISIGGKSPLTGGIKESNAGGTTAFKLARLGIKAVVLEGAVPDKSLKVLHIDRDGARLVPADHLKGIGVYATGEYLRERFGQKVGMVVIGPAGERLYRAAGVANADVEGIPSRYSGRGGLGAVMGSKGVKAVVIDDGGADGPIVQDTEKFKNIRNEISQTILGNEAIANSYTKFGTAGLVNLTNSLGALPTRNFSTGNFEGYEKINGQRLYNLITSRNGEGTPSHACMPGCLIRCSNVFPGEDGKAIVSPLEYETIGLLGSNCGIDSLDVIGKLNYLCNDIGLDTIEMGGALGVAMEAGVVEFGDGKGAIQLMEEVAKDTYLGKVLGSGAAVTGIVLGVKRVPVCKGQTMAAYDPRAIKGLGVTYATSPMGADHTAGQTLRSPVEHTKPDGQVEASGNAQVVNAIHDCIGTCFFVGGAIKGNLSLLSDLITCMTGKACTVDDLKQMAIETILREKRFNEAAGFTAADDRLPEFIYTEQNPAVNTVFDVPEEEMAKVFNF
jgi:aldehyde:ferredoxin oxidoreductase